MFWSRVSRNSPRFWGHLLKVRLPKKKFNGPEDKFLNHNLRNPSSVASSVAQGTLFHFVLKKTTTTTTTEMPNLPIAFSVHITLYYYIAAKHNRYFLCVKTMNK